MITFRGDAMTKEQMLEQFTVLGFALGMCVVERKADGVRGTLDFTHVPMDDGVHVVRYYYNFREA